MDMDHTGEAPAPEEQKRALYERQKILLDTFLGRGAITRAQYDKSLHDLTVKMGYQTEEEQK